MSFDLSFEYLQECFFADAVTGNLYWKERPSNHFLNAQSYTAWNTKFSGKFAGYGSDYLKVTVNHKEYRVHNILYVLYTGNTEFNFVDHMDGNILNNKPDNLRKASKEENCQNCQNRKLNSNNTSGHKGVYKRYGRYAARISVNGTRIHLGDFTTPEEAGQAYIEATKKHHKQFHRNLH